MTGNRERKTDKKSDRKDLSAFVRYIKSPHISGISMFTANRLFSLIGDVSTFRTICASFV